MQQSLSRPFRSLSVCVLYGRFQFNSVCASVMVQKLAVPRPQQSVPWSTAFRVASRHFSTSATSTLPKLQVVVNLAMKDGQLFTGRGQAVFDVTTYIGDFVEGKRHGTGISMGMSGFIYEGEWQHNKREGQGIIRDLPGIITSQGLFKDNKLFTGKGVHKSKEGTVYEGDILEGKFHGQGKLTKKSGKVWEGEFRSSKPYNGKGWWNNKQGVWVEGVFTAAEQEANSL